MENKLTLEQETLIRDFQANMALLALLFMASEVVEGYVSPDVKAEIEGFFEDIQSPLEAISADLRGYYIEGMAAFARHTMENADLQFAEIQSIINNEPTSD